MPSGSFAPFASPASPASPASHASQASRGSLADELEPVVRAAQGGCPHAFPRLFRHYYPGMLLVAVRILGPGPEAEDACQDAAITAIGRIGELRDPLALRSWLYMIVRNNCRTALRARRTVPVGIAGEGLVADDTDDPVAAIERSEMRNWIWHGLGRLTPALQPVAMLRYFTGNNSYEQIATLCDIPVGTVRSRLNEARRRLAEILPSVRDARHADVDALVAARRAEAASVLSTVADGAGFERFDSRWSDDLTMVWPGGRRTYGARPIFSTMRADYDNGVTYRLTGLVAGDGVAIWENDFVNAPGNGDHCPPGGTWLFRESNGKICEIRLLHAPRPAAPSAPSASYRPAASHGPSASRRPAASYRPESGCRPS